MKKMILFSDKSHWEKAIQHGIDKGINKELLNLLTHPAGRAALVEAVENGNYKIEPPKITEIPKSNGKVREVYVNQPMDRIVLSLINNIYQELYSDRIHPNCVSYQSGIGVPKIVRELSKRVSNGEKGYKADLSKYFDSVNKETLFDALKSVSTNSPLDKILWDYYSDDRVIVNDEETERYKSIAQGCAFGTFLANIVLYDIDEKLSNLDIIYKRYSDDILMIGNDADKALELLVELLKPKGLTLNPDKIEKIDGETPFTFLGAKIDGKTIDMSEESVRKYKKKIKSVTKMRKGMELKSRTTQRRAIKRINDYIYRDNFKNEKEFGWGKYFFNLVNTDVTLRMLDEYTKDHIKAMFTGKWNHTTNMHKTSNNDLIDMGYKSLIHMYRVYHTDYDLYQSEIIKKKVSV